MPGPGASAPPRSSIEDSFLEQLAETLDGLDVSVRGPFLQRYFKITTHLELTESQSAALWDETLTRRKELSEQLARPLSLKTALVDVLLGSGALRLPVLIEYDDLRKLQRNAVTDPLTGLYNRRLFAENFEKELNRARRYGHQVSLVILDLHRFKEVNDKHGHPRGDDVLRAAASTLQKTLRTSDSAFRIGGDEFALVLPQTDAAQAIALSRRVGVVFAESLRILELSVTVGMDHGVATFPQDGDQSDHLIRVADDRLYLQKHANDTPSGVPPASAVPRTSSASPSPISIESKRPPEERSSSPLESAVSTAAAGLSASHPVPETARVYAIQRKAERVSMTGTNAYAVLGEKAARRAKVLDLGFGGVALELDTPNDLPQSLVAVLHVPILPPVRVSLKPIWNRRTPEGAYRVGCCFVS